MKRGLFVCYDPHALMQFLQFYCMNDFPAEWDVLCLPVEDGQEYMHSFCEKAEIFKNIFIGNVEYKNLSFFKKLGLFLYMFFFAIIGLRKRCCKNIMDKYVKNINQYDILCSNTDTGFISGILASFGKEKDVIYFEDGQLDYFVYRLRWKSVFYSLFSKMNIQCVIMARLGYFAKGAIYFNQTRFCIKYATHINKLSYRNYKEIKEFKFSSLQIAKICSIYKKIYPELSTLDFCNGQVIFFTTSLNPCNNRVKQNNEKIVKYLNNTSKILYIKKHPRDKSEYNFSSNIEVMEIPNAIPAEILFPFLNNNLCYFMDASSILISIKKYVSKIYIFHIKELEKIEGYCRSYELKKNILEEFVKDKYEIIEL